jgi:regulator of replication initiation timing
MEAQIEGAMLGDHVHICGVHMTAFSEHGKQCLFPSFLKSLCYIEREFFL